VHKLTQRMVTKNGTRLATLPPRMAPGVSIVQISMRKAINRIRLSNIGLAAIVSLPFVLVGCQSEGETKAKVGVKDSVAGGLADPIKQQAITQENNAFAAEQADKAAERADAKADKDRASEEKLRLAELEVRKTEAENTKNQRGAESQDRKDVAKIQADSANYMSDNQKEVGLRAADGQESAATMGMYGQVGGAAIGGLTQLASGMAQASAMKYQADKEAETANNRDKEQTKRVLIQNAGNLPRAEKDRIQNVVNTRAGELKATADSVSADMKLAAKVKAIATTPIDADAARAIEEQVGAPLFEWASADGENGSKVAVPLPLGREKANGISAALTERAQTNANTYNKEVEKFRDSDQYAQYQGLYGTPNLPESIGTTVSATTSTGFNMAKALEKNGVKQGNGEAPKSAKSSEKSDGDSSATEAKPGAKAKTDEEIAKEINAKRSADHPEAAPLTPEELAKRVEEYKKISSEEAAHQRNVDAISMTSDGKQKNPNDLTPVEKTALQVEQEKLDAKKAEFAQLFAPGPNPDDPFNFDHTITPEMQRRGDQLKSEIEASERKIAGMSGDGGEAVDGIKDILKVEALSGPNGASAGVAVGGVNSPTAGTSKSAADANRDSAGPLAESDPNFVGPPSSLAHGGGFSSGGSSIAGAASASSSNATATNGTTIVNNAPVYGPPAPGSDSASERSSSDSSTSGGTGTGDAERALQYADQEQYACVGGAKVVSDCEAIDNARDFLRGARENVTGIQDQVDQYKTLKAKQNKTQAEERQLTDLRKTISDNINAQKDSLSSLEIDVPSPDAKKMATKSLLMAMKDDLSSHLDGMLSSLDGAGSAGEGLSRFDSQMTLFSEDAESAGWFAATAQDAGMGVQVATNSSLGTANQRGLGGETANNR